MDIENDPKTDQPEPTPTAPPGDDPFTLRAERDAAREERDKWKARHDEMLIEREIMAGGRRLGMLNPAQLRLAVGDMKVVGDEDVVGRTNDLPLAKLVAAAQVDPQFANLFARNQEEFQAVVEGRAQHGGKIDVRKLTPAQYRKIRREDPASIGLRPK